MYNLFYTGRKAGNKAVIYDIGMPVLSRVRNSYHFFLPPRKIPVLPGQSGGRILKLPVPKKGELSYLFFEIKSQLIYYL
jgi:hypothetical protein